MRATLSLSTAVARGEYSREITKKYSIVDQRSKTIDSMGIHSITGAV